MFLIFNFFVLFYFKDLKKESNGNFRPHTRPIPILLCNIMTQNMYHTTTTSSYLQDNSLYSTG